MNTFENMKKEELIKIAKSYIKTNENLGAENWGLSNEVDKLTDEIEKLKNENEKLKEDYKILKSSLQSMSQIFLGKETSDRILKSNGIN